MRPAAQGSDSGAVDSCRTRTPHPARPVAHPGRDAPAEVPALLDEIEAEQLRGRYVAGYLAYEAGAAFGLTVRHGPARPLPPGALACDSVPLAWMAVYPPESATMVPARGMGRLPRRARRLPRGPRSLATVKPDLNVSKEEYSAGHRPGARLHRRRRHLPGQLHGEGPLRPGQWRRWPAAGQPGSARPGRADEDARPAPRASTPSTTSSPSSSGSRSPTRPSSTSATPRCSVCRRSSSCAATASGSRAGR